MEDRPSNEQPVQPQPAQPQPVQPQPVQPQLQKPIPENATPLAEVSDLTADEKLWAALSYLSFLCILPLILIKHNVDRNTII